MAGADADTRRKVVGTFSDEQAARRAVAQIERSGFARRVSLGTNDDKRDVLRAEMRDEVERTTMGPGNVGPFTPSMRKGLHVGLPLGTAVGAVLGVLLGLIPMGSLTEGVSLPLRLVIGAVAGAAAGATLAFVAFPAVKAGRDQEGVERMPAERGVTVAVECDEPAEVERATELLRQGGPERVDVVNPEGGPEPGGGSRA